MKKLIYSMIFLTTLLMFNRCSDEFLQEKQNYNSFNFNIFQSEQQTNRFLAYIYYTMYDGYTTPLKTMVGAYSDEKAKMTEEIGGTMASFIDSSKTLISSEDGSNYYGGRMKEANENNAYTRIRNCNMIVEYMETYGKGYLTDEFVNSVRGQAYYLRALQYFDLMREYGGVPLVTVVQSADVDDESLKLPRATVAEMVKQISADFDAAAELLPSNWSDAGADFGRPTKGAALAMKSRVLLTGASPLFNSDWDNPSNQIWKDALDAGLAAEQELTSSGFGLYGTSASDWEKMFYTFDGMKCPEAINIIPCGIATSNCQLNTWEGNIRVPSQGGSGLIAPKEMIDLFPMKDGSRPTVANGYDDFLFFKDRDPRFYRTFAFSGRKWKHSKTSNSSSASTIWAYTWVSGDTTNIIRNFRNGNSLKSPAFVCKMSNLAIDSIAYEYGGSDIFEYRFAELLLNIAECYAATGQVNSCIEYLGKIRARVGMAADNNYGIGNLSDKYAAIEACLYERRVELAYEGKRFWDIQRWMLYNDDPEADNNTCEKLRIAPINGTSRTGSYLQAKENSVTDPVAANIGTLYYDPDDSNSEDQLNSLATFYTENFEIVELDDALDRVAGLPAQINWQQHYYIQGIWTEVFTYNPWIEQTIGWEDNLGNPGTYTYR